MTYLFHLFVSPLRDIPSWFHCIHGLPPNDGAWVFAVAVQILAVCVTVLLLISGTLVYQEATVCFAQGIQQSVVGYCWFTMAIGSQQTCRFFARCAAKPVRPVAKKLQQTCQV